MLPTLQSVVAADAARVEDAFDDARLAVIELAIAALVVLGGLAGVQVWLARRSQADPQRPMTWGSAAVLVTIVLGALTMIGSREAADTVHDTNYAATKALAQARIAAYDAKANESLTLVYQGSGQGFEAPTATTSDRRRALRPRSRPAAARSEHRRWASGTPATRRSAQPTTVATGSSRRPGHDHVEHAVHGLRERLGRRPDENRGAAVADGLRPRTGSSCCSAG